MGAQAARMQPPPCRRPGARAARGSRSMGQAAAGPCCHPERRNMATCQDETLEPSLIIDHRRQPPPTGDDCSSQSERLLQDLRSWTPAQVRESPKKWECCAVGALEAEDLPAVVESLSYTPGHFDETQLSDGWDQTRYRDLAMRNTSRRIARHCRIREDWLHGDGAGRAITLLHPGSPATPATPSSDGASGRTVVEASQRIPAMCYFSDALAKLTVSYCDTTPVSTTIRVVDLLGVDPLFDAAVPLLRRFEMGLSEQERCSAVLLQYDAAADAGVGTPLPMSVEVGDNCLCFLVDTPRMRERFVKALRAFWRDRVSPGDLTGGGSARGYSTCADVSSVSDGLLDFSCDARSARRLPDGVRGGPQQAYSTWPVPEVSVPDHELAGATCGSTHHHHHHEANDFEIVVA
eukprot:NODE_9490_length_1421_cov_4.246522.p1 GENE.NODE_9490_length_1421_cov_4.246522~~NODE_9490_length_1421_cov_4.246522.p1  ORF type:complete len:406 (+),score=91.91 NODE_9490_length_1421_cov_4.246522:98-1315(+)